MLIGGINKRLRGYYPELRGKRRIITLRTVRAAMPKQQATTQVTKETGHGTVSLTRPRRVSYRIRKRLGERRRIKQSVSKFRRFLIKNYQVQTSSMLFATNATTPNTAYGDPAAHPPFVRGHVGYSMNGGDQSIDLTHGRFTNELIHTFQTANDTNYTAAGANVGNEIFFALDWPGTRMHMYPNANQPSSDYNSWPHFGLIPQQKMDKPNVALCHTNDYSLIRTGTTGWERWKVTVNTNPMWADPRADHIFVIGYKVRFSFQNTIEVPTRVIVYTFIPSVSASEPDVFYEGLDRNFTTRTAIDTNIGLISFTTYLKNFSLPAKLYKKGTLKKKTVVLGPNRANKNPDSLNSPFYLAPGNADATLNAPSMNYITISSKRICKRIERATTTTTGGSTWTNDILRDRAQSFRYALVVAYPMSTMPEWVPAEEFQFDGILARVKMTVEKRVKWCAKPSSSGAVTMST